MPAAAPAPAGRRGGLTLRSVVLGLGVVLVVTIGAPYSIWMVGSSEITWSYFPIGVGAPFIVIVLVNALLRRLLGIKGLRPAELVVILSMGLVTAGIPVFIVGTLLAIISSPYYAATPENLWENHIQPYLPNWAIPSSDGDAMRWFYEGAPHGVGVPYAVWVGPLFWWLSLILGVYFVCFCFAVILRRQWVEHERLIFPLTEMPRMLIEENGSSVLGSKVFWIGCAVPFSILCFNIISFFSPGFPQIAIHTAIPVTLHRDFPVLQVMLYFPVVGFLFLASTSITFSIWFFFLVAVLQEGITNLVGYDVSSPDAFVWGMQSLSWQAWGAFMAMVMWSLWMARGHLVAVFRHVFRRTGELADSEPDEMMPYSVAVYGAIIGLVAIFVWLCLSGMDAHIALLFMFGAFVAYVGISRLVVQSGVYYLTTPVVGQAFTTAVTGTAIAPNNLVALSLAYTWHGDVQSVFMPSAANAAKLAEFGPRQGGARSLAWAIWLATVVGFLATISFVLSLSYKYGAGNFRSWYFQAGAGAGGMAFDGVIRQINNPVHTDPDKLLYLGIGALVYSILIICQYRLPWWPLHPVGLTVAPLWMTRLIAMSVFLAWAIKSVVLRYGGIGLYRSMRPFFIGLIAGFFVGVGVSFVVDVIWFFGYGHFVLNG